PVSNAEVRLESNQVASSLDGEHLMSKAMTDENGIYELEIGEETPSRLVPFKNDGHRTGVSTLDLLKVARHVLGIRPLTSAYQYIAADVTNDGRVSTADMLHIQRLVLGVYAEFPKSNSWRFVKRDFNFGDLDYILKNGFPESYDLSQMDLSEPMDDLDFIAIKIGDLNPDYGSKLRGGNSSSETLSLKTEDQILIPGTQIEVTIKADDFNKVFGFQQELAFDPNQMTLRDIQYHDALDISEDNFGLHRIDDGMITTSWYDLDSKSIEADETIFTLVFDVHRSGQLSDILAISSNEIVTEAYFSDDRIGDVQFIFENDTNDFDITDLAPNPFRNETLLKFSVPATGDVQVTISDISGRLINQRNLQATKGENQIAFKESELNGAGIYIIKLDYKEHTALRKMVLIE
ncbi:MAG: T9SS type A sorting domain-containing protein, partial [Bacteroidia bacterium]|nr:T9SS type A sorting domain-containing protein [Bacteroidia bacterium]